MAESMEITDDKSTSPAYGPAPSSESDVEAESGRAPRAPSPSSQPVEEDSPHECDPAVDQVVHICKRCMTSRSDAGGRCPECGDTLLPIRSTSDSYIGQTVGEKYNLVEQIGSGGMGEVYLGVNEPLDQRVAVKFLNEEYTANEQVIMRFLNEARSYCRVDHPNAVTLLDYGQHADGSLYIITEYVDGLSLTDAVDEKNALAPEQAISIVMQCCEVLSSAHDKGIIHRDLKPDNLMLMSATRDRYTVKVLDFGIAKIVDDDGPALTETGSVFGTPEFMSPEQAEGKPADPRSDVYALGIILFYASTGRLPFDGESQYAVLEKQIHEAPPKASSVRDGIDVHPAVERVIETCLQKDREKRYATADELFEALEEALQTIGGGEATGPDLKTEGSWSESGVSDVDLTKLIEDSDHARTRGYPAGKPNIDSRAETATGPRVGGSGPKRFEVGDRLRSVDLSREEPREHGVTLPDSDSDPWRRSGLILTGLFVAVLAGWQMWSSLAPVGPGNGDGHEPSARRDLAAASAALDRGAVEPARERVERAASTLSPEDRGEAITELFAISRMRLRDVADASDSFRRAVEAGNCGRATDVGEQLVEVAPDATERVADVLNDCSGPESDGGTSTGNDRVSPSDDSAAESTSGESVDRAGSEGARKSERSGSSNPGTGGANDADGPTSVEGGSRPPQGRGAGSPAPERSSKDDADEGAPSEESADETEGADEKVNREDEHSEPTSDAATAEESEGSEEDSGDREAGAEPERGPAPADAPSDSTGESEVPDGMARPPDEL